MMYSILSDTVLETHRKVKIQRMDSAALLAVQLDENDTRNSEGSSQHSGSMTSSARKDDQGKIYLIGNPLKSVPENICQTCYLPSSNELGKSNSVHNPRRKTCAKRSYITTPGYDVHGRPLKDEKDAETSKNAKIESHTDSSQSNSLTPSGPDLNASASDIYSPPTAKCPNCPRYLIVTKMAQHMAKCLGISERKSSRDAKMKIQSINRTTNRQSYDSDQKIDKSKESNLGSTKRRRRLSTSEEEEADSDWKGRTKRARRIRKRRKSLESP